MIQWNREIETVLKHLFEIYQDQEDKLWWVFM